MNAVIMLALFGWPLLAVGLFQRLAPHRAVIACIALPWMFLPQFVVAIPGLPDFGREVAVAVGLVAGVLVSAAKQLTQFRPSIIDLPVVFFSLGAIATSVTNGLGIADGISWALERFLAYGVPWFAARIFIDTEAKFRELILGIFLAGLLYVPFLLFEMVMSPQLHRMVYGFHPHDFDQSIRGSGYRPVVFMKHGLATAIWTMSGAIAGIAILRSGWRPGLFSRNRLVVPVLALGLVAVLVMSRSSGALFLFLLGCGILLAPLAILRRMAVALLILVPILYMGTRGSGSWDGQNLVNAAADLVGEERSGSLGYRLYNETMLVEKASEQRLFGWGRFQRSFVTDELGKLISVPDGLWVLSLGRDGVFGLINLTLLHLLPLFLFLIRYPLRALRDPISLVTLAGPAILGLQMIDNLLNAMPNPMMILLGGALSGVVLQRSFSLATVPESGVATIVRQWLPRAL